MGSGSSQDPAVTDPTVNASDSGVLKGILTAIRGGFKTYRAVVNAHAPHATPTDWLTILGSATKLVRVTRIAIAGRATAANQYRVSVLKYTAAYTSGTPAAATIVPLDSANPVATAVVNTWASALPTVGTTLVGALLDESIPLAVLATPTFDTRRQWMFGEDEVQPAVLRGVGEYLALNSGAVALPGGSVFDVAVEWTEE